MANKRRQEFLEIWDENRENYFPEKYVKKSKK